MAMRGLSVERSRKARRGSTCGDAGMTMRCVCVSAVVTATAAMLSGCGADDGAVTFGGLAGAPASDMAGAGGTGSGTGGSGGVATGGAPGGQTGGVAGTATGGSGGSLGGGSGGLLSGGTGGATTGGTGGSLTGGTGGQVAGGTGGSLTGGTGGNLTGGTGGELTGGTGGAQTGGSGGTGGDEAYPCNGDTSGYNAVAIQSGNTWTVTNGGSTVYTGSDMESAMVAAYNSLSGGRSSKQSVLIDGSGDISASSQVRIPSYTIVNVCGTINVTGSASGSDRSPMYARGATDIEIPHLTLTGNAQYGMFFRDVSNLHLGNIHINGTGGLGIRIDSHGSNDRNSARNITIDYVHVENTGGHGVEFYGVDGIEIGTVVARSTADCGLILNDSINANIGLVDAVDAAYVSTGYAAFRTANTNGRYADGSYPTNIRLGELRATGGGRGFFCVSASGGVQIDNFTIDQTGGDPSIFIENCYNVTLASSSGSGTLIGGRAYIGHNSGNGDPSRDVTFQNITLQSGARIEQNSATCGLNNVAINVTGGTVDMC
jgi:hypothetical protein